MKLTQKSLVAVALLAALSMTACSSSDDDDDDGQNPADTQNDGTDGTPSGNNGEEGNQENPDAEPGNGENPDSTPDNGNGENPDSTPDNGNGENPDTGGNPDIPNNGDPESPDALVDLRTVADDILQTLAGYELEELSLEVIQIAQGVVSDAATSTPLPDASAELTDQLVTLTYPVTRVQYDCAQGGTLIVGSLDVEISDTRYSSNTQQSTYLFDQCQLSSIGEQTLDGAMNVGEREESGRGYTTSENTLGWEAFQWQQSSDRTVDIDASIRINENQTQDFDDLRTVSISTHTISSEGIVLSGIKDASLVLRNISLAGSGIFEDSLEIEGDAIDRSGAVISVATDPKLFRKFVNPAFDEQSVPFNGQISYRSSDRSSLEVVANGSDSSGNRLVNITYTDAQGNTSTEEDQIFDKLEVVN